MSEMINLLQWPAMFATLLSAWLVASQSKSKRKIGFWVFIVSNILWVIWGFDKQAYALILMQAGLFILNVRGIKKNNSDNSS